jgi:hypothetical protein
MICPHPEVQTYDGIIKWRDLTDNWRVRILADDLLDVVRNLGEHQQ